MKKILIGTPIKQKETILKEFLKSLLKIKLNGYEIHYYFVDDNTDDKSSKLLENFQKQNSNVKIEKSVSFGYATNEKYVCDDVHQWKKGLINRIISFKNDIISYADKENFDYLFFIDSDILINPITIKHLIDRNVEIVSNVFWTSWNPGERLTPQVWLQDESSMVIRNWDRSFTKEEINQKEIDFIAKLKIPGIYEVGGLGACTLISKSAIKKGVNFSLIPNISFWGEDRHFCIRASVLGIKLYVDTVYPAYHIYREEYLNGVSNYLKNGFDPNTFIYNSFDVPVTKKMMKKMSKITNVVGRIKKIVNNYRKNKFLKKRIIKDKHSITLSMIVKNEEHRYLKRMLEETLDYVDNYVIIDDASTDGTVKLCEKILKDKNHKIIVNETSMFSNEYKLRKKQWDETINTDPDFILFLDADEIFENEIVDKIDYLLKNDEIDTYCFRLYDMWDEKNYREDEYWNAHSIYRPFLIRYQPNFKYKFLKKNQHCGRMPYNVTNLNTVNSEIRIKHYGWADANYRKAKYERYMLLDPEGKDGSLEQYKSIMDENPILKEFK